MRTIFCIKCEQQLPVEHFYANYVRPKSKRGTCKRCFVAKTRAWQLKNSDVVAHERKKRRSQAAVLTGAIYCRKCERNHPADAFYKADISPKSRRGTCKKYSKTAARRWVLENPEKRAHWCSTSEKFKSASRKSARKRRLKINAYRREWYAKNRDTIGAIQNSRAASSRGARMPAWANKNKIREFYLEACRLTKQTGIKHHVDHVIPIKGKTVCGLHIETNLQILKAAENQRKHNKLMEAAY